MRPRLRRRLAIPAAMLSILSTGFSCSYGDDEEDEKDKDRKKVEALASGALIVSDNLIELGLQAAQAKEVDKPKR
jgi:hypothetical protein